MSYPWLRLGKGFGGFILSLALLELLLHISLVQKSLPLPSPYYNDEVLPRKELLRAFKRVHGEPETIILGSSIARTNFDAELLGKLTGKRCFGLGFSAFPLQAWPLNWQKLWSAECKGAKTVLLAFREYDLLYLDPEYVSEVLGKGRIELGWLEPSNISPIESLSLSDFRVAQYYGGLSKALSVARRPFFRPMFPTTEYGTALVRERVGETNLLKMRVNSVGLDPNKLLANVDELIDLIHQVEICTGAKVVPVLTPVSIHAWESASDRDRVYSNLSQAFKRANIRCCLPDASDFALQDANYIDLTHYSNEGATRQTEKLASFLVGEQ